MEIKNKGFLSAKFEHIKKSFNLNNTDLAKIGEVSPTAIRDIIEGVTDNPKISLIRNICKSLQLNYDWFFEEDAELMKVKNVEPKSINQVQNTISYDFLLEELERYRKREDMWLNSQLGKFLEVLKQQPFGLPFFWPKKTKVQHGCYSA
jgi:DNA-binding XRE family transcriptional regulator